MGVSQPCKFLQIAFVQLYSFPDLSASIFIENKTADN